MDLLLSSDRGFVFGNTAGIAGIHDITSFFDFMLSKSSLKSLLDIADEKRSSRTASYVSDILKVYPSRCEAVFFYTSMSGKINNYYRFLISILEQPAADRVFNIEPCCFSSRSIFILSGLIPTILGSVNSWNIPQHRHG